MTIRIAHLFVFASCVASAPVTSLPPPIEYTTTYRNSFELDQPTCSQTGPCQLYEFRWPANANVQIELRSETPTILMVRTPDEHLEMRGSPGKPAVVSFGMRTAGLVEVHAAVKSTYGGEGDYELLVGPNPELITRPPPPPTVEQRRRQIIKRAPVDSDLELAPAAAAQKLEYDLGNIWVRDGSPTRVDMANAIPMSLDAGWCYQLQIKPTAGSSYSELARRGMVWRAGNGSGTIKFYGSLGLSGDICSETKETVTVALAPKWKPRGDTEPVGKGQLVVERLRRKIPLWPGLYTRADLEKRIAEVTRGKALERTISGLLESGKEVRVKLKADRCYATVVRLRQGAQWADGTFRDKGPVISDLIGPGAASSWSCLYADEEHTILPDRPVGTGGYDLAIYSRVFTAAEKAADDRATAKDAATRTRVCTRCRQESRSGSDLEICAIAGGLAAKACFY
jgi:hypothetical protein